MKSLALFLCLAQLWGCHSVPVGPALVYRELDCDDPETEQAALVAVDYINNHVLRGYKHTLNQIDKVKVWPRRPMGEVFELEIDTLETTCHVLDPTPLANCTVRPQMQHVSAPLRVTVDGAPAIQGPRWFCKVQTRLTQLPSLSSWLASVRLLELLFEAALPGAGFYSSSTFLLWPFLKPESIMFQYHSVKAVEGDCDFRLLKQDGQFTVLFAKCDSSPDSAEDVRKVCPQCPLLAPLNDTRVVHAVDAALTAFNAQSNGSYFRLVEVSRAQLTPLPPSTYVEFAVAATDCVAAEVTDPAKCNLLAEKQYGFCKATLTEKVGGEDVAVTCTVFQTQPLIPQPQPDGTEAVGPTVVADPGVTVPEASPDLPAAALVVGPVVVAIPEAPLPEHRAHYDLRHAFMGVASVESASGEAFHVGKVPKVVQPDVAVAAGPVVHPCPGRIRHFKI